MLSKNDTELEDKQLRQQVRHFLLLDSPFAEEESAWQRNFENFFISFSELIRKIMHSHDNANLLIRDRCK